ncbi:hypothetical protein Tco_1361147 [Tanacetum coccineum]
MNKPEVETMSIDDLYNNFKFVKQKVKKTVGTSSGGQNLAFMTAPSTSSTNDANTASPQVSAASPSVNTVSPAVCTANVSDNTMYAFMVENPNGSNVIHQDLEKIHEDDLEAMDLKWKLSLLSVREKKYYQRTGKNIFINANDTAGYDKSKTVYVLIGVTWQKNISDNKALLANFYDSEATYKRGLATLEDQIITYKKNEVLFSEEIGVLKRDVASKDYEINVLKSAYGGRITGTSEENSQDCIVMPIWKDTSYFDSPTMDVNYGEPKTADDAQKQVEDGPNNENAKQERFADDSSTKDVNAAGQHINTVSPDVNTGSLKLNVVGPSVNTSSK